MAVRPVLRYPDPVLKRPAEPAGPVTPALRTLLEDLIDTMRASPATVGLAAPQIGASVRACVLDVSGHPRGKPSHGLIALLDPEVLETAGAEVRREGCLSVPDLTADVRRAHRAVLAGVTREGHRRVVSLEGFEARAALHEI